MNAHVERLAEEALALPTTARADLARRLLESLDEESQDNAETAGLAQAVARSEEIDRGVVEPVPADELFRRVRARFAR